MTVGVLTLFVLLQLITVFDADMVCSTEFFVKTLPRIVDDRVSLVLTPQAYHNYDPAIDIFNHSAYAYWSMMVPGEDAWGHIVCTGGTLPLPFAFAPCPLPSQNLPSDCLCLLPFNQGLCSVLGPARPFD